MSDSDWIDGVAWNPDGLVPAVAQDAASGEVLMLAWMNREALARTVESGEAVYWSRSRKALWRKGETSGHTQRVAIHPGHGQHPPALRVLRHRGDQAGVVPRHFVEPIHQRRTSMPRSRMCCFAWRTVKSPK